MAGVQRLQLARAARALRDGLLVLYPTEGVWGLGCDPDNPDAVAALLDLKQRKPDKGLIVVADQAEALAGYVADPADMGPSAPPVTWVVTADPTCPAWLTGGRPTIAARVTRHPVAAALSRAFGGPIVSTSANRAGRAAARTPLRIDPVIRAGVAVKLGGACGPLRGPTPIRDVDTGDILR